jgi:hypothetical protein
MMRATMPTSKRSFNEKFWITFCKNSKCHLI